VAKVLGVGGVFFKARDQATLRDWYARVLGLSFEPWGGVIFTPDAAAKQPGAATTFSSFRADSNYFAPSAKEFMINLMVDDLTGMLARCDRRGIRSAWHSRHRRCFGCDLGYPGRRDVRHRADGCRRRRHDCERRPPAAALGALARAADGSPRSPDNIFENRDLKGRVSG